MNIQLHPTLTVVEVKAALNDSGIELVQSVKYGYIAKPAKAEKFCSKCEKWHSGRSDLCPRCMRAVVKEIK